MNRLLLTLSFVSLVLLSCTGSKSTNSIPADAVGVAGGEYLSYQELKENFVSGSLNKDFNLEDIQEFLPVYLDYKGKILSAKDAGYYNDETIESEFQLYAKQAAYAYWVDNEIRPTKFNEFKKRFEKEVKSSHILIAADRSAPPADTLAAYNTLMEAREQFLAGADFDSLSEVYSSTRQGRSMGGELPWFSVGTTVKEFEDALYSLEVGEVSLPVRTQFGYHIIYLKDARERVPSRQLSHIFNPVQAEADADSAYAELKRGVSWKDVVSKYSKDRPSVPNQGYIGWMNYGSRYDGSFLDMVMNLDPAQPYSEPIKTVYGFHIFKIDSVQTFASEEAKDEFILEQLKASNNYKENNSFVVTYLEGLFGSVVNINNLDKMLETVAALDTTTYKEVSISDSLGALTAYTFGDYSFTNQDFLDYLIEKQGNQLNIRYQPTWFKNYREANVDDLITDLTIDYFPEFEGQITGYKDGLVVYQINEDSVWSSATLDSSFVEELYQENIDKYQFNERYHYYMITSRADSNLDKAKAFVMDGNSPDSLVKNGFSVGVNTDSTGAFQGEPFTMLSEMEEGSFSTKFEYSNRKGIFYLIKKLPARSMTLEEAYQRVVSDYQPVREEKWLQNLRSTYNVEAYPDKLEALYYMENPQ